MNKNEYIEKLRVELKQKNVKDIDEILKEYNDHFEFKQKQGKTEEEIANKLAKPSEIALEFAFDANVNPNLKFQKVTIGVGVGFIDLIMSMMAILLFSWVVVLGAVSLCTVVLGIALITNLNVADLIPYMPYIGKILLGISCLSLSILSAIGTIYCYLYIKQWIKAYFRWHKNTMNNVIYPSMSLSPESNSQNLNLRLIAMISLVGFGVFSVIALLTLMSYASNAEFWHEWNWFQIKWT